MLLLPCTCSCDVPNGNAADIDSSIMQLSAGVTVLVHLGGYRHLFHTGAGTVHVYMFLMPATTPVVPALKNSYTVPRLYLQPSVWPTAQLPCLYERT